MNPDLTHERQVLQFQYLQSSHLVRRSSAHVCTTTFLEDPEISITCRCLLPCILIKPDQSIHPKNQLHNIPRRDFSEVFTVFSLPTVPSSSGLNINVAVSQHFALLTACCLPFLFPMHDGDASKFYAANHHPLCSRVRGGGFSLPARVPSADLARRDWKLVACLTSPVLQGPFSTTVGYLKSGSGRTPSVNPVHTRVIDSKKKSSGRGVTRILEAAHRCPSSFHSPAHRYRSCTTR